MMRRSGDPREPAPSPAGGLSVQTLSPLPTGKPSPSTAGAGGPKTRAVSTRLTAEQIEACMMVEAIGEIGQAVRARGALISGCQFFIGLPDTETDGRPARDADGVALVDERLLTEAEDFLAQVVDGAGSQRGLLRAQSENYDGPGVAVMLAWYERADGSRTTEDDPTRDHLRFEVVGANAYREEGSGDNVRKYVRMKRGGQEELLPRDAGSWRMFNRHSGFPGEASSWVLGVLPIARNLLALQLAGRSQALSLAVGEIHLVPSDAAPKMPLQEGMPAGTVTQSMTPEQYQAKVEEDLGDVIAEIIEDTQSGRTVVGGVWAVEAKYLENFGKKITVGRQIDEGLADLEAKALTRLKESADIAPEMLTGLGDSNRWNGAQIDDMEYRRYHRPHVLNMADDWTTALLWPYLLGIGYTIREARQVRVLVNTKGVVADPDMSKVAEEALKAGALTWEGYAKMREIPPEYIPTPAQREEIKAFLGGTRGMPGSGSGGGSTPPDTVLPVNDAAGSRRQIASASTLDLGATLRGIEQSTRQALAAAGAVAMDAALTRAGSKMSNLARKHLGTTAAVRNSGFAALGALTPDERRAVAEAEFGSDDRRRREEMFAAAILMLRRHYEDVTTDGLQATLQALGIDWPAATPGRSPHTAATISRADIDAALESGWNVLDLSLTGWADATVFGDDPLDTAPTVPNPVWRRSMAAVGGAVVTAGWAPIRDEIATMTAGPRLAQLEPPRDGYEWYYGSAGTRRTPFAEHMALDGVTFSGPDDDVLSGAPWGSYWPGDHEGCACDVIPAFADTSDPTE